MISWLLVLLASSQVPYELLALVICRSLVTGPSVGGSQGWVVDYDELGNSNNFSHNEKKNLVIAVYPERKRLFICICLAQ